MKKQIKYILAGGAVLMAVAAAFVAYRYFTDYKENVAEKFSIYIYPDTDIDEVADSLSVKLLSMKSFRRCFKRENPMGDLAEGFYTIKKNTTNKQLARTLSKGWQTPYRVTLSGNIRGTEKLASILGKKMMRDSAQFSNWFNNPKVWDEMGLTQETFPVIFIPNTYEMYWTATPEEFTARMKKEYDKFWNEERTKKAEELGMTRTEVSILASIVCEESNYNPELSTIAGVYINRLKRGMRLEADPTVKFALNDPTIKRILFKHLKVDSPYNTYKVQGLPPGPITIPSAAGIDAVLYYKQHDYLYFCANENLDGTHKFARTLSQHNKNARAYQSAISKLKIK